MFNYANRGQERQVYLSGLYNNLFQFVFASLPSCVMHWSLNYDSEISRKS